MAYILPETLTVMRKFKLLGVQYNPEDIIPSNVFIHARGADSLLSRRFVIPTPDPHQRRTRPSTPTPTAMPAKVRQQIKDAPTGPTSISVNPSSASVRVNESTQLVAVLQPPGSTSAVSWSSSSPPVANVDSNGLVTGGATGNATITATTEEGLTATCAVNVQSPLATGVTVNPATLTKVVGETQTFGMAYTPSGSVGIGPTLWSSTNPAVMSVAANIGTAVAAGTCQVKCTDSGIGEEGVCEVTVTAAQEEPETARTGRRRRGQ